MNSYIFNFKNILFSIFFFGILFFSYNIFISYYNPSIIIYQNQWQKNYVFAENYIYGNKPNNLIVGSSMAALLDKEVLGDGVYNLSFAGGSVLSGLEILKRTGFFPKTIYIENNVILKAMDKKLIESLFHPINYKLKSIFPAFKEKYQPLNLIISIIKSKFGSTDNEKINRKRNEKIYKISIIRYIENYNKGISNYQNELSELINLINYFKNKNVKIIFFEMPIDDKLVNSKRVVQQRNIIKENFNCRSLPLPDNSKYTTSDGIHLMYKSSIKFSKELSLIMSTIKN